MVNLFALFETVFLLNVTSAFVSPAQMVMSWVGFSRPEADPAILAGVTACAVMIGRSVLTWLPYSLVRNRWVCGADRQNIDVVHVRLEDRKSMTTDLMLVHAFSPSLSNYTFIAYGLTGMRLRLIGLPLFVGCWVSYPTWAYITQISACYLDEETEIDGVCMGVHLVVSQIVPLMFVYEFVKLDW